MLAEPGSEFFTRQRTGGQAERHVDCFVFWCAQIQAIQPEKRIGRKKSRTLIAIDERVVADDSSA